MAWRVGESKDPEKEAREAVYPRIRVSHKPCATVDLVHCRFPKARWVAISPETARELPATAYFFARQLHRELGVPVGMIVRAVGGTPAAFWIGSRARRIAEIEEVAAQWKPVPRRFEGPWGRYFDGLLEPVIPYAIRGVIWDQGESGTGIPAVKSDPMRRLLIRSWRELWGQGNSPFLFVQYPKGGGWRRDGPLPPVPEQYPAGEWGLASLEHAAQSVSLPDSWMAITMDLEGGVHPLDKQAYARRLAAIALGRYYGKPIEYYGPLYKGMKREGNVLRLSFDHVGTGLVALGRDAVQGFAIAGEDGVFHWAEARIEGDSVLLRSGNVARPVAARYGWAHHPKWCNLFNREGYPALPFRTDAEFSPASVLDAKQH